ncbi:MAG TPA: hypothetical protein DER09_09610 [Prolixibacteraceae bacterium]|nr:hypothetical protein [Prolixibacteraceae bacterium]
MSNNSETGHAVNVANFNDLISFVTGYGSAYNPTNPAIMLPAMQTLSVNATGTIAGVNAALPAYNAAVAAREVVFAPLSKRVTRVMNFLKSSGVTPQVYDQVNAVARKVKGTRASAIIKPDDPADDTEPSPTPKQISASQMSYDSRTENFGKMIQLLAGIPEYNPNEEDLKIVTLTALHDDMKNKNNTVLNAEVPLSNARIARNNVLYAENTGLYDIALKVKMYVSSVFGTTSPQYKQISKLKFTKLK